MRRSSAPRVAGLLALVLANAVPARAHAREAPAEDEADVVDPEVLGPPGVLRARADAVSFDAGSKSLELVGNVRIDGPPFHLRAQRIQLTRTRWGIEVEGKGKLAFCPCLGTPLTLSFDGAVVAPPGDLVLEHPALQIYGVPVAALPYFWLRSDEKVGVLPPDLAYRGKDGVFVGGGVHVPFRTGTGRSALDLRSGAYVLRGFVVDARLRTPSSTTKVRFDRLPSSPSPALPFTDASGDDGLLVDARGATDDGAARVGWDVDVLRGRRGVASTTELDAAAKPWDRAAIEAALGRGPLVVSTGVLATTRRGGGVVDVEAAGPVARVRSSGALGSALTWDVTGEGGALRVSGSAASAAARTGTPLLPDTLSFARVEGGVRAGAALDALELSLALRGAADAAREGRRDGVDRAGSAGARVALPLARTFADAEADLGPRRSPLVHVVEPFVDASLLHADGDALLGVLPGRGAAVVSGTAPVARAGVVTSLGRASSRDAAELEVSGGGARPDGGGRDDVRPLLRGRLGASTTHLGATADGAAVFGPGTAGRAGVARARVGRLDGLRLLADVAVRDGVDPVLARALTDAPLEPSAGFLDREGTTGGASVVIPWSEVVTTSAGADADLGAGELVAARGSVELRDRCRCVTLRGSGSHRLGRRGVDVWLALDFATNL